jgi:hypothetical protein
MMESQQMMKFLLAMRQEINVTILFVDEQSQRSKEAYKQDPVFSF